MKFFLIVFLLITSLVLSSQPDVNVYFEEIKDGFGVFADNSEYCPVSVEIKLELQNLSSARGDKIFAIIPPNAKKHYITKLKVIDTGKESNLGSNLVANYGNHKQKDYDTTVVYQLPWKKGGTYNVFQGYNGTFSHQGENALDFSMDEGTEICAARDGIVITVEESNSKTCMEPDCAQYNNYILIYHSDGTFAVYTHIRKNGAVVSRGDEVKAGQMIGYSGNVGWSSGPHLHFSVFLQKFSERVSIETRFKTGDGTNAVYLKEGSDYSRDY